MRGQHTYIDTHRGCVGAHVDFNMDVHMHSVCNENTTVHEITHDRYTSGIFIHDKSTINNDQLHTKTHTHTKTLTCAPSNCADSDVD